MSLLEYSLWDGVKTLVFSPTPTVVPVVGDSTEETWQVLHGGEVRLPDGMRPAGYTLSGFFPGGSSVGQPWAPVAGPRKWRPPIDVAYDLQLWQWSKAPLTFIGTVAGPDTDVPPPDFRSALFPAAPGTNTPFGGVIPPSAGGPDLRGTDINAQVYISHFTRTWGHLDHLEYELHLVERRVVLIPTDPGTPLGSAAATAAGATDNPPGAAQPPIPADEVYTVKYGDSLTKIAIAEYDGDGTKWTLIFDANRAPDGPVSDPDLIQPGWKLTIPSPTSGAQVSAAAAAPGVGR